MLIGFVFVSSKGDFDASIAQYIRTIGKLEASYVIRKVNAKPDPVMTVAPARAPRQIAAFLADLCPQTGLNPVQHGHL